jgi:hypothetical protein
MYTLHRWYSDGWRIVGTYPTLRAVWDVAKYHDEVTFPSGCRHVMH